MIRAAPASLANARVTVAGLGTFGGGVAVARWLARQGARVLVTDQALPAKLADSVAQLDGENVTFVLGEHRARDFTDCDLLIASPAVPPTSEHLAAARAAGVPVTTEIALFTKRCRAPIAAVTGTKGKSTTTALLHRMLAARFGARAWLGGNIGVSLLDKLPEIEADHVVALELSSFMLYWLGRAAFAPRVGVVTMLGRDHLDWHGDVAAYHAAKLNVTAHQSERDAFVFRAEDVAASAVETRARKVAVGDGGPRLALDLPGEHNQRNAQLALAAASEFGVTFDEAQRGVAGFAGLPHRLQFVHEAGGVRWYDDSIATIPEAAVTALGAFDAGTVVQIVGGSDKGLDLSAMCRALAERVRATLTIGALGPGITASVRAAGGEAVECGTLDAAVEQARRIARAGDVVLLSPGCASYDQFANFQHRGRRFAELARVS